MPVADSRYLCYVQSTTACDGQHYSCDSHTAHAGAGSSSSFESNRLHNVVVSGSWPVPCFCPAAAYSWFKREIRPGPARAQRQPSRWVDGVSVITQCWGAGQENLIARIEGKVTCIYVEPIHSWLWRYQVLYGVTKWDWYERILSRLVLALLLGSIFQEEAVEGALQCCRHSGNKYQQISPSQRH